MHVYERQSDNGLKLVQNIPEVHTGIDNFQLTHAGDALLVGAHPVPYKIMRHLRDPKFKAPSSVSDNWLFDMRVISLTLFPCCYHFVA